MQQHTYLQNKIWPLSQKSTNTEKPSIYRSFSPWSRSGTMKYRGPEEINTV